MAVVAARLAAPVDVGRLPKGHLDVGRDAANLPVGAHDFADNRVVPAVLYGDEKAFRLHVALDEVGGPLGIVGLHRDEGEIEQLVDALGLGQVHGVDRDGEIALAAAGPQTPRPAWSPRAPATCR